MVGVNNNEFGTWSGNNSLLSVGKYLQTLCLVIFYRRTGHPERFAFLIASLIVQYSHGLVYVEYNICVVKNKSYLFWDHDILFSITYDAKVKKNIDLKAEFEWSCWLIFLKLKRSNIVIRKYNYY